MVEYLKILILGSFGVPFGPKPRNKIFPKMSFNSILSFYANIILQKKFWTFAKIELRHLKLDDTLTLCEILRRINEWCAIALARAHTRQYLFRRAIVYMTS